MDLAWSMDACDTHSQIHDQAIYVAKFLLHYYYLEAYLGCDIKG